MAGKDGTMAKTKSDEQKQDKAKSKRSNSKRRTAESKPRKRLGRKQVKEAQKACDVTVDDVTQASMDGAVLLRNAMNVSLAQKSQQIAEKLAEQAEKGNITSAKIMIDLVLNEKLKTQETKKEAAYLNLLEEEEEFQGSGIKGQ